MRVMIFGTFDRLHPGHRFVLEQAQARGDLTVVIARDHHVDAFKKRPPVEPEAVRRDHVAAAFPNAMVMLGDDTDFLAPVRAVKPDLILLGYDQKLPPGVTEALLGCPIERLPAFAPERYKSSKLPPL